jgi:hypothetical protein
MTDPIEIHTYKGIDIKILPDPDPMNPRDWENANTMVCWHRRYKLGDAQPTCDPDDYLRQLAAQTDSSDEGSDEQIPQRLKEHFLILPLYLYDHSGLRMKTTPFSCPWDSGQVGWIYTTLDHLVECYGSPDNDPTFDSPVRYSFQEGSMPTLREAGEAVLRCEVCVYDQYLSGEVYGWETDTDSCGGFFGSDFEANGLLETARDSIDARLSDARRAHYRKLKQQIKHRVPLGLRTA